MLVALTAVLVTGFYALNVPIKLAFFARVGNSTGASIGVRVFEGRFALRAARRKLAKDEEMKKWKNQEQEKPDDKQNKKRPPFRLIFNIVKRLLKHIQLEYLNVSLDLGLSDAANTALAAGAVNALLAAVTAASGAKVVANVHPNFQDEVIKGEFSGIVSLTTGHIILAALLGTIEKQREEFSWTGIRLKAS